MNVIAFPYDSAMLLMAAGIFLVGAIFGGLFVKAMGK